MPWDINITDEFERWYLALDEGEDGADSKRVRAAIEALEYAGPSLARPWADRIDGSRHHNMKELRPRGGFLRVLFAFDPRRQAILLLGGDKRGDWTGWYERTIPIADDLYDAYLDDLRDQGLIP